MSKTIMKYLLALCLICNVGNAFAQHRYYCEVKGIEKAGRTHQNAFASKSFDR